MRTFHAGCFGTGKRRCMGGLKSLVLNAGLRQTISNDVKDVPRPNMPRIHLRQFRCEITPLLRPTRFKSTVTMEQAVNLSTVDMSLLLTSRWAWARQCGGFGILIRSVENMCPT